jgi:hypothetical protein
MLEGDNDTRFFASNHAVRVRVRAFCERGCLRRRRLDDGGLSNIGGGSLIDNELAEQPRAG